MGIGQFDSDTGALARRINSHDSYGAADITTWIFDQLDCGPSQRVLDLGCGTGKQSIPAAVAVGDDGRVLAVDVSPDATATVDAKAREAGVADRVTTLTAGLDDLAERLGPARFDRVVGCYSLYYAADTDALFATVRAALDPGGVLFFCGPSSDNNAELKRFHHDLRDEPVPPSTRAAAFMEHEAPAVVGRLFDSVETFSFANPLTFASADALHEYWSSYNLFDAGREDAFRSAAARHFEGSDSFVTTKRAVGVRAAC